MHVHGRGHGHTHKGAPPATHSTNGAGAVAARLSVVDEPSAKDSLPGACHTFSAFNVGCFIPSALNRATFFVEGPGRAVDGECTHALS